jgi:hypothetical protein
MIKKRTGLRKYKPSIKNQPKEPKIEEKKCQA